MFKAFAEFIGFEVPFEGSIDGEAEVAGFFGDDDGYGVGFFGEAESGAVAEAEGAVGEFLLADREDAGGGGDAFVADDDASVVKGGFGVEEGEGEFGGEFSIDGDAGFDLVFEADVTFDGEECPEAFFGEDGGAVGDEVEEGLFFRSVEAEEARAAEAGEAVAEFGLEDDDEGEGDDDDGFGDDPLDDDEFEELGDEGEADEDDAEADEDAGSAGGAEEAVKLVDEDPEDKNLQAVLPVLLDKVEHGVLVGGDYGKKRRLAMSGCF